MTNRPANPRRKKTPQFGELKIPRDVRVRDAGTVTGDERSEYIGECPVEVEREAG